MKCRDVCLIAVVETSVPIVTRNCSSLFSLTIYCGLVTGETGQQGMLTPPWHLIPLFVFRGPCCPMFTEFVYVFWTFLTISTLVSLILVFKSLMQFLPVLKGHYLFSLFALRNRWIHFNKWEIYTGIKRFKFLVQVSLLWNSPKKTP